MIQFGRKPVREDNIIKVHLYEPHSTHGIMSFTESKIYFDLEDLIDGINAGDFPNIFRVDIHYIPKEKEKIRKKFLEDIHE
jgi:hypothetical protein